MNTAQETVADGASGTQTLTCSAGKTVLGGGVLILANQGTTPPSVAESGPSSATQWRSTIINNNTSLGEAITVQHFAICAVVAS